MNKNANVNNMRNSSVKKQFIRKMLELLNKSAFETNKKLKESDFMKSRWHANKKNKQQSKCNKNALRLKDNKKRHAWQRLNKQISKSLKDRLRSNA